MKSSLQLGLVKSTGSPSGWANATSCATTGGQREESCARRLPWQRAENMTNPQASGGHLVAPSADPKASASMAQALASSRDTTRHLAPATASFRPEDDASRHRGFEELLRTTMEGVAPCQSSLNHGFSVVRFAPTTRGTPGTPESLPSVGLAKLRALARNAARGSLRVRVGVIAGHLVFSAKRIECALSTRKRDRTGDASMETERDVRQCTPDTQLCPNGDSKPADAPFSRVQWACHMAHELRAMRESPYAAQSVFDSAVVLCDQPVEVSDRTIPSSLPSPSSPSSPPSPPSSKPFEGVQARLVPGAALDLVQLDALCLELGAEDGILTCDSKRQAALADIGTPMWRAGCAHGLLSATLVFSIPKSAPKT